MPLICSPGCGLCCDCVPMGQVGVACNVQASRREVASIPVESWKLQASGPQHILRACCAAGAIHETGHALYEQGRNLQYDGLPVNQVRPGLFGLGLPSCMNVWAHDTHGFLPLLLCGLGSSSRAQRSITHAGPHPPRLPPLHRRWAWACTRASRCCGSAWWACRATLQPTCCH